MVRSDNVSNLNDAGVQAMWDYGVSTVIDLRSESEVAQRPSPFAPADYGPTYLHLPLVDDALAPELNHADGMATRYTLMLDRRQQALGKIFSAVAAGDGAVVFHCFAGKDRTGLVAAMILRLVGVEPGAIASDYSETDQQLASKYEEWLAAAPPDRLEVMRDELRCPPEWMLGALDHIDRKWGGVKAYLGGAGVRPAEIARMQAKLT